MHQTPADIAVVRDHGVVARDAFHLRKLSQLLLTTHMLECVVLSLRMRLEGSREEVIVRAAHAVVGEIDCWCSSEVENRWERMGKEES